MMNFEERKAEIFRRSDERIKIRKRNRKRILLSCVPLVICIGVLSAAFAQNYYLRDKDSIPENWNSPINTYSLAHPVTVELTDLNSGETRNIEACSNIIGITDIIFSITEGSDRLPLDNYGDLTESTDSNQDKGISNIGFYEITITREPPEEEKKVNNFILNGNILIDENAGREYQLSDDEFEALSRVLCLSDQ